jgi:hypothetical protein
MGRYLFRGLRLAYETKLRSKPNFSKNDSFPGCVSDEVFPRVAAGAAIGLVASIGIARPITTLLFNVGRESIR